MAIKRPAQMILADTPQPRTFTPRHRDLHRGAFLAARGWTDVRPYFELRNTLPPNTGAGFWGIPSADCYAGIAPRWYTDVWGDHNREDSLVTRLTRLDVNNQVLVLHPGMAAILKAYGVTHVLSSYPQRGAALPYLGRDGNTFVYRVEGAARARFVRTARYVQNDAEAGTRLLEGTFDPEAEILLHDVTDRPAAADGVPAAAPAAARAAIIRETQRDVVIDVEAPHDGFLLLADTYYPGWTATVDGTPTPVHRANLSVRGIRIPAGRHEVRFAYDAPGVAGGLRITLLAIAMLLVWAGIASYSAARARRYRRIPSEPQKPITA